MILRPITVAIVARRGVDADGLATAVSVLGPDRGMDFIETQPGVAALVLMGRGITAQILESSRWSRVKALGQSAPEPSHRAAVP